MRWRVNLRVDPRSGYPIYLQVVEQVRRAVALGTLMPGEQLPTIKQLATDLVVNPSTIARAFRELEHLGVLESLPGRGCWVRESGSAEARRRSEEALRDEFDRLVRDAHDLGLEEDAVRDIVTKALMTWYPDAT